MLKQTNYSLQLINARLKLENSTTALHHIL